MYDLVYVCDSRPEIGNGHLKRGTDVLHALLERRPQLRCALSGLFSPSALGFIESFVDHRIDRVGDVVPPAALGVLDTMADPQAPQVVERERSSALRSSVRTFVVISSALEVRLPVRPDVLIDHMPDAKVVGEQPLKTLLGFDFAPVAREFVVSENGNETCGVLAVIGGGPEQVGPNIVAGLLAKRADTEMGGLDIVVSPHFPEQKMVDLRCSFPSIRLHRGVPTLVPLMRAARAVVCTYGNITYESLVLAKPTFVTGYKQFQVEYAEYLQQRGLVVSLGRFDALTTGSTACIFSREVRSRLAAAAQHDFSSAGIERIADVLERELPEANHRGVKARW